MMMMYYRRRLSEQHLLLFIVLLAVLLTAVVNSFLLGTRRRPSHTIASLAASSEKMEESKTKLHVVIAGAGIIGTCTAYYLVHNHDDIVDCVTLIDPTGRIAPAASGKAGGFLAQNWNDGSPTQELTRRSFVLHQELADVLSAESIQYRRLTCASIAVDSSNRNRRPSGKKLQGIEWAQPNDESDSSGILGFSPMGDEKTIAQVHPRMLCERLWQETCKKSPKSIILKGKVAGAVHDASDGTKLIGAKLYDDDSIIKGDALLFACGPWTANIMQGIKYHSAIIPTDRVLSQCVFFSGYGDPEVYVRPDSTAYCTGYPDAPVKVTEEPGEEVVRPEKIATIVQSVRQASGATCRSSGDSSSNSGSGNALGNDPILEQACYLPTTSDGVPVMGRLPSNTVGVGGGSQCYIATGHTCWGILLGPASGEAMANLIATGQMSTRHVNLERFSPNRFSGSSGSGIQLVGAVAPEASNSPSRS